MKVTEFKDGLPVHQPAPRMTQEQLQNDFDYYRAEKITKKLLDAGLITAEEYKKTMKLNRETFKPFLYQLMPDD